MRLLIVDDDPISRKILMAVCRKWGYQPIEAINGEAAWAVLQQPNAPMLLLLDWMMPKLDGPALCRKISESMLLNPPYIILLTAKTNSEDIVGGLESGANDYVGKPFEPSELKARLSVGKRMLALQDELNQIRGTLEQERTVIENIILKMRRSDHFNPVNLRHIQSPVEKTAGDLLLSAVRPGGIQHLMIGDFTGHGLVAAIGGPAVSDIFYAMTRKGISMREIATEINHQVFDKLPSGLFLAAIMIEISVERERLRIWNCGMPELLIYRQSELLQRIASDHFPLGIVDGELLPGTEIPVVSGDLIYSYTDGITEAMDVNDQQFGQQRLEQAISGLLSAQGKIEMIIESMQCFCGNSAALDDITLVELTC